MLCDIMHAGQMLQYLYGVNICVRATLRRVYELCKSMECRNLEELHLEELIY